MAQPAIRKYDTMFEAKEEDEEKVDGRNDVGGVDSTHQLLGGSTP